MSISTEMINEFHQSGLLFCDDVFKPEEINGFQQEIEQLLSNNVPGTIFETDDSTVRGMHGCHLHSETFEKLTRHPLLLNLAKEILKSNVYVHQFKINFKQAFRGDKWDWHQDFIFWKREDKIREPKLVNILIALDEVNEFNGPLFFIPGSHREGTIEENDGLISTQNESLTASFSSDLKYTTKQHKVAQLVKKYGLRSGTCKRGSIIAFDGNIVHASSSNISPFERKILIITYNDVSNTSILEESARPAYVASRKYEALT